MSDRRHKSTVATAGLPETAAYVDGALRKSGIDPDRLSISKLGTIYRGVWPFVTADIVRLCILIAIPSISLVLPQLMG